jgi:iron-sulfur cluster assembly protein
LVDGTEIDFLKQGLNEQFVFRNPNVAAECGCGESFTTDADKAA